MGDPDTPVIPSVGATEQEQRARALAIKTLMENQWQHGGVVNAYRKARYRTPTPIEESTGEIVALIPRQPAGFKPRKRKKR